MSLVTITTTGMPSRSKQAGPCWVALTALTGDPAYALPTYGTDSGRALDAEIGDILELSAKATLRRATRTSVDRESKRVVVTGDPTDTVAITVGSPQSVDGLAVGVREIGS